VLLEEDVLEEDVLEDELEEELEDELEDELLLLEELEEELSEDEDIYSISNKLVHFNKLPLISNNPYPTRL